MNLSSAPWTEPTVIVRDSAIQSLGFVTAQTPGLLVYAESVSYLAKANQNPALSAVITTAEGAAEVREDVGLVVTEDPRAAFYGLHNALARTDFYWKPFRTEIAASASVHPRAYVAEWNVRIGERCVIEPMATILEHSILDEGVIVRAGTIVAGEGFQFATVRGALLPVAHAGGVHLHRNVEVQHNSVIDRSVFNESTRIGESTKIDNGVHVAHNCQIGARNLIVAGAMIGGSVRSGDDVWFGPMCAVVDGLCIGSRASISIGAVVTKDVPDGARVSGNFAIDHGRFLSHIKAIR